MISKQGVFVFVLSLASNISFLVNAFIYVGEKPISDANAELRLLSIRGDTSYAHQTNNMTLTALASTKYDYYNARSQSNISLIQYLFVFALDPIN